MQTSGEILLHLSDLLANLETAESAQRGYLLTGDEGHRALLDSAGVRADIAVYRLRGLLAERPEQLVPLEAIVPMTRRRLNA